MQLTTSLIQRSPIATFVLRVVFGAPMLSTIYKVNGNLLQQLHAVTILSIPPLRLTSPIFAAVSVLRARSGPGCPTRGRSAQPPSCADWLYQAVTVTSYSRMRSSLVGLQLVDRARDLGRRRAADQSRRGANRDGTKFSRDPEPPRRVSGSRRTVAVPIPADLLRNGMH